MTPGKAPTSSAASAVATNRPMANRVLIPLLRSAAGRVLGRRLALIDYQGRRAGLSHELVVLYDRDGPTVHIDVGMAGSKTWWLNFETAHPVRLRLAGTAHDAVAHLERDGNRVVVIAHLDPSPTMQEPAR